MESVQRNWAADKTEAEREEWRDVAGEFKGWPYQVSNQGRVRLVDNGSIRVRGRGCRRVGIKKTPPNGDGYPRISLLYRGVRKAVFVHRLVAAAFIGPREQGREVNHKNGIKADNFPENLEYVAHSENMAHASKLGLMVNGENRCGSKLTKEDVVRIRELYAKSGSQYGWQKRIASQYGVHPSVISRVVYRHKWKHVK